MPREAPLQADTPLVFVMATLDTKGEEAAYLVACLEARQVRAQLVDAAPSAWISPDESGSPRDEVMRLAGDRLADEMIQLVSAEPRCGAVVIGGATGAALGAPTLKRLPLGVPKLLLSPVASGDTGGYVGTSDTVLVSPVADFVGRDPYVDRALETAADMIATLAIGARPYPSAKTTSIALTAFGVTSLLVEKLGRALRTEGLNPVVFSANGTGGRAFEGFIRDGRVFAALDVTTSELADELCGGVLSAGSVRLTTAASLQVPQVVLPGGVDFVNFGPAYTVPDRFSARPIVRHTDAVTLVRTSRDENAALAEVMAERLAPAGDSATVVLPLRGFSRLSAPGGPFHDEEADAAFSETIVARLGSERVVTVDAPINSNEVSVTVLGQCENWRVGTSGCGSP